MTKNPRNLFKMAVSAALVCIMSAPLMASATVTTASPSRKPGVVKSAPRPVKKAVKKKRSSRVKAQSVVVPRGNSWRGVITGIQDKETFYMKLSYRRKTSEVRVKVSADTKFVRVPAAAAITDFFGGDVVQVDGTRIDGKNISASDVKFLSDEYKNY